MGNLSDLAGVGGAKAPVVLDPVFTINYGELGSTVTAGFSGIKVDRGSGDEYRFGFRESDDKFVFGSGNDSSLYNEVVLSDGGSYNINAATVTNGVYNTGDQTIAGTKTFTSTIVGSINGNAATVTNGVYTTGDQSIAGTKTFSSTISGSISGNAATVTNGVYTTGNQSIAGTKTFSSTISGSISGNAATVTNGVYTTGNQTIAGNKTLTGYTALGDVSAPSIKMKAVQITTVSSATQSVAHGITIGSNRIKAIHGKMLYTSGTYACIPGPSANNTLVRVAFTTTNVVLTQFDYAGASVAFSAGIVIDLLVYYTAT